MPLAYPLPLASFLDVLKVSEFTLDVPELVEASQTAGGEMLSSTIGNALWQGEVQLGPLTPQEAQDARVLISTARKAGGSFLVTDIGHRHPKADPGGAATATKTPAIAALPSDARLISLSGVPNLMLTRGDYLSFTYMTGPVRYAFHRVVDASVAAGGDGLTGTFEVEPPLQPGATVGTPVALSNAICKAIIVPGSVQPGRRRGFTHEGMSFRFQQTLR